MQHAGARKLREDYRQAGGLAFDSERGAGSPAEVIEEVPRARPDLKVVEGERRTVVITGQPVPPRRRKPVAAQQIEARPDRIALWAFLLGLFLVFMAVATANAGV